MSNLSASGVSEVESDASTSPRVRWYRRRPPADMDRFARGVWWAGHGQLYLAVALAIVGPFILFTSIWRTGWGWLGLAALALSWPFALSGVLLRKVSAIFTGSQYSRYNAYGYWSNGITLLILAVIGIAALAFAGVFVNVYVLIMIWATFGSSLAASGAE